MKQILLSIRMLLRFKVYTFVNFIGLAISLACVFTITRYIHQENTVDHCYPEYKRIYFIERSISDGTKELSGYQSDLEKDPAVERYASFTPCTDLVMDFGKQEITVNALSIDSTFFSIFPYSIYMGSVSEYFLFIFAIRFLFINSYHESHENTNHQDGFFLARFINKYSSYGRKYYFS